MYKVIKILTKIVTRAFCKAMQTQQPFAN